MGLYDSAVDIFSKGIEVTVEGAKQFGKGAYSAGEDIVYGGHRTLEGLNFFDGQRQTEIGFENEYLVKNLYKVFKVGLTTTTNPLFILTLEILSEYYYLVPEEVYKKLGEAAAKTACKTAGKMVAKSLAKKVIVRILQKIAATSLFKQLAKKIGISTGVGATGVGLPLSALMLLVTGQGTAQKASHASKRLKKDLPELFRKLRSADGLDMLFFLVEAPLKKQLDVIVKARKVGYEVYRSRALKKLSQNVNEQN